ncbi:MAG TPA: MFS transporter, partial [Marmoricola sp.]|nr:MFS transporter [Marmoricola sp.]
RYTGYFMATFGSASVLGPVIGGLLAGTSSILGIAGWRWVFLVNVPVGILALFVIMRTLHVEHTKRESRVDWMGAVALVICLVPLLVVAEQGREWGWSSGRSLACFAIGLVGLVLFIVIEARMKLEALIPLKLFTIKAASVTIVASVIVGMGMFGGMMLLPLYMQIVHGASPTQSGFLMLPMVAGMMSASLISGRIISKTGRTRPFPIAGSLIMAAGLFLLSQITADTSLWKVDLMMALVGYGVGNCMQPLILTMQSSVPPTAIGVATSSATFFRQIGGTVGVAVFLSMLFASVGTNIGHSIKSASADPVFQKASAAAMSQPASSPGHQMVVALQEAKAGKPNSFLSGIANDSAVIQEIKPTVLAHPLKQGFANSMTPAFAVAGGLGVLAFLVLLLMPEVKLRETSAAEARSAAAEAAG